ncbi:MAG: carboxymuconolactone decarboxylase family protein [Acidimicrobiia bacterium]
MPFVDAPHEDEWSDEMAPLRDQVVDPTHGRVDWIMRIHALDPGSMESHYMLYRQAMKGTKTLRKVEREMIALVVSQANDCHY